MLTEKDYCDYDTCVALKELEYKVPTSAYYIPTNDILYPNLCSQVDRSIFTCFFSHNSAQSKLNGADLIDAPTLWEAQKWLRKEKGINIFVMQITIEGSGMHRYASYIQLGDRIWICRYYSLYEEALLEGIKETVKILKEE